jgi:hypothetical protein
MDEPSPRQQLRTWIKERMATAIAAEGAFNAPALREEAIGHFEENASFLRGLVREVLPAMFYEEVRLVASHTRGLPPLVDLGGELVTGDVLKQRAQRLGNKWANWIEHVGDRFVPLRKMNKRELLDAVAERQQRVDTETEIIRLWRAMAKQLKDGEMVEQRFSAEQIEALRESLAKRSTKTAPAQHPQQKEAA